MTEDEILDERARLYAHVEKELPVGTVRCLDTSLQGQRWLFPKTEIRLLLPHYHVTPLPRGVRWQGWPCLGLITHSLRAFPLLCWSLLAEQREPSVEQEHALLLLRSWPVVLRVPAPVGLTEENLDDLSLDRHPWSLGRGLSGASLANLERLKRGGA